MHLTPAMERYVLHWGEMGTRWGVNRSVAQIHALLYLADGPLHADELTETLGIARSNVSMSLKELQSWRLVNVVHVKGDRRDHFTTTHDLFELLRLIADGRKQREIDPTLTVLRNCVADAEEGDGTPEDAARRMREMLNFVDTLDGWYVQMRAVPVGALRRILKLGAKIVKLLP